MISAAQVVNAGYQAHSAEVKAARASMEAEMFRAELAYRDALPSDGRSQGLKFQPTDYFTEYRHD